MSVRQTRRIVNSSIGIGIIWLITRYVTFIDWHCIVHLWLAFRDVQTWKIHLKNYFVFDKLLSFHCSRLKLTQNNVSQESKKFSKEYSMFYIINTRCKSRLRERKVEPIHRIRGKSHDSHKFDNIHLFGKNPRFMMRTMSSLPGLVSEAGLVQFVEDLGCHDFRRLVNEPCWQLTWETVHYGWTVIQWNRAVCNA